jgi:hypothetical protein
MTYEEEMRFIDQIIEYVAGKPERISKVITAVTAGIISNSLETRAHAVDMETIAAMALNARLFKGQEVFIANKIEGWSHKNSLRWDQQVAALRKKAAQ